ncbi:hypothetical protein OCU04_000769 [Sclerotinia nivalis]|uniref:Uncharacterized protein n=1 Tax=Sclerotinia nivalis TaxID=352851 RepID=A0A9X0AZZ0_9HELO|nr:hypothetical protein OCU04_000769 [Sclerotinia nivalis]
MNSGKKDGNKGKLKRLQKEQPSVIEKAGNKKKIDTSPEFTSSEEAELTSDLCDDNDEELWIMLKASNCRSSIIVVYMLATKAA